MGSRFGGENATLQESTGNASPRQPPWMRRSSSACQGGHSSPKCKAVRVRVRDVLSRALSLQTPAQRRRPPTEDGESHDSGPRQPVERRRRVAREGLWPSREVLR